MITSPAGTRFAKAGFRLRALVKADTLPQREDYIQAEREYDAAAKAVVDELIAQGFHEKEGD